MWAIGSGLAAGIVLPILLVRIDIGTYLITLLILFFVQKGETHHWKKQSASFEQLYRQDQAAFATTVAKGNDVAARVARIGEARFHGSFVA